MARRKFTSVWDAIEDTAVEAANMRARSGLMIALRTKIEGWKVNQAEAARRLGLTQPRLNDLMRGRISTSSALTRWSILPRRPGSWCACKSAKPRDGLGLGAETASITAPGRLAPTSAIENSFPTFSLSSKCGKAGVTTRSVIGKWGWSFRGSEHRGSSTAPGNLQNARYHD